MPTPTYLIYLDDYHLGDPLFLQSMARMMHRRATLPPCLMVHGSGGEVERRLEADGLFPEVHGGLVQVETPEQADLVERGMLSATRRIVGTLVDEIIYAVGFQGTDRGLLQVENGAVHTGATAWLRDLIKQQAIPVVAAIARDADGGARQVRPHEALLALADALGEVVLVFFTKNDRPGLMDADTPRPTAPGDTVPDALLPDPEAFRAAVASHHPVLLTSTVGLFGGEDVQATQIQTENA